MIFENIFQRIQSTMYILTGENKYIDKLLLAKYMDWTRKQYDLNTYNYNLQLYNSSNTLTAIFITIIIYLFGTKCD